MPNAYLDGLKMLARRELSEAQVRQRLARRDHDLDAIDDAVARLKTEHAIDDVRTATAIVRTEVSAKRRGRIRIEQALAKAGIRPSTSRQAIDDVFRSIDTDALITASLARRLRGQIRDDRQFARLYRYLVGQGFEPDRVMKVLDSRRG